MTFSFVYKAKLSVLLIQNVHYATRAKGEALNDLSCFDCKQPLLGSCFSSLSKNSSTLTPLWAPLDLSVCDI